MPASKVTAVDSEERAESQSAEEGGEQQVPETPPAVPQEPPKDPEVPQVPEPPAGGAQAAPTLSLREDAPSGEQDDEEIDGEELLREINPGRGEEEEDVEYVEVSTTGRLLGTLAFVIAAGTLAASALGYLPLGGIKEQQLPSGSITQEKIAPGAVGIDQISLEARDELAGPEGPRGPRGPKGEPGVGIGQVSVAEATVSPDRDGVAEGEANCRKGKAIGGGAEVVERGEADEEVLVAVTANTVLEKRAGWRAAARSYDLGRARARKAQGRPAWRLRIYALCARPQPQQAQAQQGEAADEAEGEAEQE